MEYRSVGFGSFAAHFTESRIEFELLGTRPPHTHCQEDPYHPHTRSIPDDARAPSSRWSSMGSVGVERV